MVSMKTFISFRPTRRASDVTIADKIMNTRGFTRVYVTCMIAAIVIRCTVVKKEFQAFLRCHYIGFNAIADYTLYCNH